MSKTTRRALQTALPKPWPSGVDYLSRPKHSQHVSEDQKIAIRTTPVSSCTTFVLPTSPQTHISIIPISDPAHPACGQHGLFAARILAPDELVTIYLGFVHGESPADKNISASSDYDISLDRDIGLAIDAASCGNEGRFVNDYRGVPRSRGAVPGPNAEFRDVWMSWEGRDGVKVGERGIGIFVLGVGKSRKRRFGLRAGEEVLVSYGRGFWDERRKEEVG